MNPQTLSAVLPLLGASLAWLLGAWWLRHALRRGLLDRPNQRSSHQIPTPRGGGLAPAAAFLLATLVLLAMGRIPAGPGLCAILGTLLMAGVGTLDDHGHVPALARLGVQFLAVGIFLPVLLPPGAGLAGNVLLVLLGVGLVWCINLYNFMDGIDALAASEAVCLAVGAMLVAWSLGAEAGLILWLACLAGAALGFLPWNLPRARMFMGDAGSGFFGYIFAFFATLTCASSLATPWTWMILGAVFIADASFTLLRRILRGEKFYQAHRSHGYQIASRRLNSHGRVSALAVCINICWLWPLALAAARLPELAPWICLGAYVPLTVLLAAIGAGATND